MFDLPSFIAECDAAVAPKTGDPISPDAAVAAVTAVERLLRQAIEHPDALDAAVRRHLGDYDRAPLAVVHQSPHLMVQRIRWPGRANIPAHDHSTWAISAVYRGNEHNVLWHPAGPEHDALATIEHDTKRVVAAGDLLTMDVDGIHSIYNPGDEGSWALHVYGADLMASKHNEWDAEGNLRRPAA